jgi:hypothetical protein
MLFVVLFVATAEGYMTPVTPSERWPNKEFRWSNV